MNLTRSVIPEHPPNEDHGDREKNSGDLTKQAYPGRKEESSDHVDDRVHDWVRHESHSLDREMKDLQ